MNLAVRMFLDDSSLEEEEEWDEDEEMILLMILEEEQNKRRKHGGSVVGRQTIHRKHQEGHRKLMADYFDEPPVYPASYFRWRFRMYQSCLGALQLLLKAMMKQKRNSAGTLGLSCYQKITAALWMMCYGIPADLIDDQVVIGESTTIKSLRRFARAVICIFGPEYLRAPTEQDTQRILEVNKARGFPGMLGSIDCMHWRWKNCPAAWHGQFTGHVRDPTVVLEAVADQELWIWHAYFGMPGSCNDINVAPLTTLC